MKVLEHEHPLKLIDLQVKNKDAKDSDDYDEEEEDDYDEEDEEKKNVVAQHEFVCPCKRCDLPINEYYRYYYKCVNDSCDYSLHKFCAEVPPMLTHTSHSHPLRLKKAPYVEYRPNWTCFSCESEHKTPGVRYMCFHPCYYRIDISCSVEADKKRIRHPSHPHPLVPLISKPSLCLCNACGEEHKGIFFQCVTCSNFAIHSECAFLPKSVLIQQTTNDIFHHTHPLTLSYSFPKEEQEAKYDPTCRLCNGDFFRKGGNLWIYKCEKCIYYAHLNCATSRKESFMSIMSISRVHTVKNFEDADYPHLVHLPFPDQTYNISRQLFVKEIGPATYDIKRVHRHKLILVDVQLIDGASSSSKASSSIPCHNPMKRIVLLCNGCVRPITEMPFYKCGANEDETCNFALHEWCTRLPAEVYNHPGHPQHPLFLVSFSSGPDELFGIFHCDVCLLRCNGYAYCCEECDYNVDVTCGFIPENITHKSHAGHILSIDREISSQHISPLPLCFMCLDSVDDRLAYSCRMCCVYMHPKCALLLPETVRHAYDKHPLKLSYLPIENHKSEYFCEICETELNPHICFYHCDECAQSMHSACAPSVICCERESYSINGGSIYLFSNLKFGSIYKNHVHPHPLSLDQGFEGDGQCSWCNMNLWNQIIFKCLKCKFAIDNLCFRNSQVATV